MRIISKRRAMTIYRQHPASRIFRYCTGRYQCITPVWPFLTFPACWRYTPNAARTATDPMPV
ncbi:YeeT [Klebsiella grimontii]|nr:YeeT [Klebsiella grimontii]